MELAEDDEPERGPLRRCVVTRAQGERTRMLRFVLGPVATIVLVWMCWQTLKIPQTMAATGLLYIAVMSVLVGEMLGRFILFRTAIPL